MTIVEEIFELFARRGTTAYFGERISVQEHCLQTAHFGRLQRAEDSLVVAALLHDIGHLVVDVPERIEDWTCDAHHEQTGSAWLDPRFGPDVAEPVRLHVPAKRYLCATDADYRAHLSPASVATLALQGGPMSAAEVTRFEQEPYHRQAIELRRWDDQGKVVGLETLPLEEYRATLVRLARIRPAS